LSAGALSPDALSPDAMCSGRRSTSRFLAAFLVSLAVAGCTLEQRANGDAAEPERDSVPDRGVVEPPPPLLDPAESVRVTMEVFREAVRVGDLSLALGLMDGQAVLMDDLAAPGGVGMSDPPATRGELLLELRRRHGEGLLLRLDGSELRWLGDHALLVSNLVVLQRAPDPDDAPEEIGSARETALLQLSPEGWRIVHLHRSLGPVPDPAGADRGAGSP
jgi:hypothetical protein